MNEQGSAFADEHLVARCLDGDDRAWTALIRRYTPLVFSLALRSCGRRDEAEDQVQEVFVKISRMLERHDRSAAFKPWLLQVTRNHLIDHHRSRQRERAATVELDALPVEPAGLLPTQATDLLRRERSEAVARAVQGLPEKLREAVLLRDVEGLEYDDIAKATGLPIGTVKSRINRGRLALAQVLAPQKEGLA